MKAQTFVSAKTTVNKLEHVSHVTIDWTGMTDDDVQALAQRSMIIRWQNANRTKEVIPNEKVTLKAVDYRLGVRLVAVESIEDKLGKLSDEEFERLMAAQLERRTAAKPAVESEEEVEA
jgi:hypothetical protein